jgi:Cupin
MKALTRRVMRLAVMTVGLAGLFVAVNPVPGAATAPVGLTSEVLGRGTNVSHGTLPLRQGMDIVVLRNTLAHGGSSGWHSHPGGAIVVVQQGEITIYASVGKGDDEQGQSQSDQEGGPHCVITRYTKGQAFVEAPGEVVVGVNTGSTETIIVATFPGVPVGGASRIDQPNPGTCPGV